jgi:trans-2,3-dihydro-3-hydroxyanthranilate isomerase
MSPQYGAPTMTEISDLDFDIVDVFAERAYDGNPLAVVYGSEGLTTAQMRAIAHEIKLAETAFPVSVDGGRYVVRIFTPEAEVASAGHPTLGTAWALHRRGLLPSGEVVQRCGADDVDVFVSHDGAELTVLPRQVTGAVDVGPVLGGLGLTDADVVRPARLASCGLAFVYVAVRPDCVRGASPLGPSWVAPPGERTDPLGGVCVYAAESFDDGVEVRARVFCPEAGITEDPGTGSAAAGLGLVLLADGMAAAEGKTRYRIRQGLESGRRSVLHGWVEARDGRAFQVRVGGGVVPVASGRLTPPTP